MKKFLCGLAVLPFLTATALAQPMQLSASQMDSVSAGFAFFEVDVSNTSWTEVSVYQPDNTISCSTCYLLINNQAISVASHFGPVVTAP